MPKGRFAPSPTGRMHLGNVYAALLSWLSAKSKGGEWLLRIEDIDPGRSKQEYADQIGADAYSKDAMQTVRYCDEVFGVQS